MSLDGPLTDLHPTHLQRLQERGSLDIWWHPSSSCSCPALSSTLTPPSRSSSAFFSSSSFFLPSPSPSSSFYQLEKFIHDFSSSSLHLSFTPPPLAPLLPRRETPPKLSNNVFSFTWPVLDYLPGPPCRPIKDSRSHGHCLASSAFIMVIN